MEEQSLKIDVTRYLSNLSKNNYNVQGRMKTQPQYSSDEDKIIKKLIEKFGQKWQKIADKLNKKFFNNQEVRIGKSVRERYFNHLFPNLKRSTWTKEEDLYLIKSYQELGKRWAIISRGLKGRTDIQVRNRFQAIVKKYKNKEKCNSNQDFNIQSIIVNLQDQNKTSNNQNEHALQNSTTSQHQDQQKMKDKQE